MAYMQTFGQWLQDELDKRAWSQAELARRANIGTATLSRIVTGARQVGPDVALSIARAIGVPPEQVFRAAGLLPQVSEGVAEEQEALHYLRHLPAVARDAALAMLRGLARQARVVPFTAETSESYSALNEPLVQELLAEFRRVPDDWQAMILSQVRQVRQMADSQVRIVGEEEDGE